MGVPGFFLWLHKNYKKTSFVFRKDKLIIEDLKLIKKENLEEVSKKNELNKEILDEINNIDYFLIDTNCLIHPMCFKILAENPDMDNQDKLENKMIDKVLEYIEEITEYVKPKKGIYIAIDGVAPVAKIKQQRSRRFKSVHDKDMFNNIRKKYNKPIPNGWNNSAITPGTEFMEKLHKKIVSWSEKQKIIVIYSSCNTPSEGEHKLLQFIRNNKEQYKYVLYGLDADLIFLALSTNSDYIYLLREANQINKNEPDEILNYVSIRIMRDSIKSTLEKYYEKKFIEKMDIPKLDKDSLISDFIFLCYFLGNDFLPHLPSLNIHKDGIEYLIESYINVLFDLQTDKVKYLLGKKVNNEFLNNLVGKLAEKEESILKESFAQKKRFQRCDSSDNYEKEVFKIENLQFKVNDPILLGSDNQEEWRRRYYKYYFGCTSDESINEFSKKMVENYLIGIKWVTKYYFDKCPSWDWYYPYEHPPFLGDIKKFISGIDMNKINFSDGKPLKPFMQLLCVLPQQSNYLLPGKLRSLMSNPKSSLAHLYPLDFDQDFIGKTRYWMGIPLLPALEIDLIKYIYNKYQDVLSNEEKFRNRLCDNYLFNNL